MNSTSLATSKLREANYMISSSSNTTFCTIYVEANNWRIEWLFSPPKAFVVKKMFLGCNRRGPNVAILNCQLMRHFLLHKQSHMRRGLWSQWQTDATRCNKKGRWRATGGRKASAGISVTDWICPREFMLLWTWGLPVGEVSKVSKVWGFEHANCWFLEDVGSLWEEPYSI